MTDPTLLYNQTHSQEAAVYLMAAIKQNADGMPPQAVINATLSVLIDVIAQSYDDKGTATEQFDKVTFQAKKFLETHYSRITGKKLTVVVPRLS